jgi:hypothetical protein
MSKMKGEIVKLKNERELYGMRVTMMWDRLDFQQKLHQRVNLDNVTIEEVVKIYKQELSKVKAMTKNLLLTST